MSRRVNELQRTIEELRKYMVTDGHIPRQNKATSPLEKSENDSGKPNPEARERTRVPPKTRDGVVMRPPLKGMSVPISVREDKNNLRNEDAELSRQIIELVARRRKLHKNLQSTSSDRSIDPSPATDSRPKRSLPRIVLNIQVIPPPVKILNNVRNTIRIIQKQMRLKREDQL